MAPSTGTVARGPGPSPLTTRRVLPHQVNRTLSRSVATNYEGPHLVILEFRATNQGFVLEGIRISIQWLCGRWSVKRQTVLVLRLVSTLQKRSRALLELASEVHIGAFRICITVLAHFDLMHYFLSNLYLLSRVDRKYCRFWVRQFYLLMSLLRKIYVNFPPQECAVRHRARQFQLKRE